mmetsp:Transcript_2480/g.8379  ORF Transcript_2480/g.8379 Transcript_2480/m.8379 type:complete len:397 (-) Transcript_2480:2309-3499(-)
MQRLRRQGHQRLRHLRHLVRRPRLDVVVDIVVRRVARLVLELHAADDQVADDGGAGLQRHGEGVHFDALGGDGLPDAALLEARRQHEAKLRRLAQRLLREHGRLEVRADALLLAAPRVVNVQLVRLLGLQRLPLYDAAVALDDVLVLVDEVCAHDQLRAVDGVAVADHGGDHRIRRAGDEGELQRLAVDVTVGVRLGQLDLDVARLAAELHRHLEHVAIQFPVAPSRPQPPRAGEVWFGVVGGVEATGVAVLVGAVQLDLELLIAADGRGGGARRARHDGHRQRGQLGLLLLLELRQPHRHLQDRAFDLVLVEGGDELEGGHCLRVVPQHIFIDREAGALATAHDILALCAGPKRPARPGERIGPGLAVVRHLEPDRAASGGVAVDVRAEQPHRRQ